MSSIERMKKKYLKDAERHMKDAIKYTEKSEYSHSAAEYESAASSFEFASDISSCDNALRLASEQRVKRAEQYTSQKFEPNLIGLAYKSAYQDLEKLKNKTDSDKEAADRLRGLAEDYLKSAVSEKTDMKDGLGPYASRQYKDITTDQSLRRVTKDESIKEEMDKKIVEDTQALYESNKRKYGIFAEAPLIGLAHGSELRRQSIDKGIAPTSEFVNIYETAKKSIERDEESKAYGNAAYRSLNLANEASERGYTDILNEMSSKALELYKKAEERAAKKGETREFCKIKEGEAKAYIFIGNAAEGQKAIEDAINAYKTEAQEYENKKKRLDAKLDLEDARALAVRYNMQEAADELSKRISELEGM